MESDFDEQAERPAKTGKRKKGGEAESYEELATVALSRARQMLKRAEPGSVPDPMVSFLLESAQVLATLEVAAAIRAAAGGDAPSAS
jgi:hypothetical protein